MISAFSHDSIARWFFLILSLGVFWLFWQLMAPFAITLLTAGIAAILLSPLHRLLSRKLKSSKLSAGVILLAVFILIVGPLATAGVVMVDQALELGRRVVADPNWFNFSRLLGHPWYQGLPVTIQNTIQSLDLNLIIRSLADWATNNAANIFKGGADLALKGFIFFLCLYFCLIDREKIKNEMNALSPLKNSVDNNIAARVIETVRGVVFGSLIVSLVQGLLAALGLAIFGVPAWLLLGGLVVIAAQIPMIGTTVIMLPAVFYLLATGHVAAAIGLLIWSMLIVGTVDNVLKPYVVGGKTKMNSLLILLSMLGGIQLLGPIGLVVGPTILSAFLVVLELYKNGILESRGNI